MTGKGAVGGEATRIRTINECAIEYDIVQQKRRTESGATAKVDVISHDLLNLIRLEHIWSGLSKQRGTNLPESYSIQVHILGQEEHNVKILARWSQHSE